MAHREWQTILDTKTVDEVLEIICRDDENSRRLRQSSPFCILPQARRTAIFKEFEALAKNGIGARLDNDGKLVARRTRRRLRLKS